MSGPTPELRHDSFAHRVREAVAITVAVVLVLLLIWKAFHVVLLVFAGVLFALFLHGIAGWIERHTPLSHGLALAAVLVTLVLLAAAAGWFAAPRVSHQVDRLTETLPRAAARLRDEIHRTRWGDWLLARTSDLGDRLGSASAAPDFLASATGVASATLGALVDLVIVLFLGVYLAAEWRLYRDGLVRLIPPGRRDRAREVLGELGQTLSWWLVGRFSSMAVIGVMTLVGLWALSIPLALTLSILAALLTFIPNFGPIVSVVPPALLALEQSPTRALWVLALYAGIQTLESYLITPLIQRRAVRLPPALLILSQVLIAVLTGLLGLVLATPLLAAALVLIQTLYVEDVLGDRVEHVGARG